jgi:predicted RNA-binding protein with RPS1 domain
LVVARFVKAIKGRGITVQVNEDTFGFIEIVEITDDITGNIFSYIAEKLLFPARVIDSGKDGKVILSARETVVDPQSWTVIGPEGQSIHFQKMD